MLGATTVSVSRERLLDRGLIDANKHGHLSFTVPGFSEFVIDQAENDQRLRSSQARPMIRAFATEARTAVSRRKAARRRSQPR